MGRTIAVALALGATLAACGCRRAPAPASRTPPAAARIPGEYLVTLAPGADVSAIREIYGSLGVAEVRPIRADVYLVSLAEDPGPARMDELRRRDARIAAVQPNLTYGR